MNECSAIEMYCCINYLPDRAICLSSKINKLFKCRLGLVILSVRVEQEGI